MSIRALFFAAALALVTANQAYAQGEGAQWRVSSPQVTALRALLVSDGQQLQVEACIQKDSSTQRCLSKSFHGAATVRNVMNVLKASPDRLTVLTDVALTRLDGFGLVVK